MENLHLGHRIALSASALIVCAFSAYFLQGIYRIFFHPLRKYPGPPLAVATCWPFVYHRLRGDLVQWHVAVHEKYGPVARILPNTISYNDGSAWRDIYGHKVNGRGDLPKDAARSSGAAVVGGVSSILLVKSNADHSRQRKLLSHAMSDKVLREQEQLIQGYVRLLVEKISDVAKMPSGDGSIDLAQYFNFTAFDIIADLSFGQSLGMLNQGEWLPWLFSIFSIVPMQKYIRVCAEFFPVLLPILRRYGLPHYGKAIVEHTKYSQARVEERLARKTERPDFWTYILRNQGKESGAQLSQEEMRSMSMTLMVAGSETTSTLLTALFWVLLTNRRVRLELTKEIRNAFTSREDITMSGMAQLPYLQACLDEALRMYPPVLIGLNRQVPPEGRMICDGFVPGGTVVQTPMWATFNAPSNFHDPGTFAPERWLPKAAGSPFAHDKLHLVQPFSVGPRNCIGKNLAYHEARVITTNLIYNFDLEVCPESRDLGTKFTIALGEPKRPLMVRPALVAPQKQG